MDIARSHDLKPRKIFKLCETSQVDHEVMTAFRRDLAMGA